MFSYNKLETTILIHILAHPAPYNTEIICSENITLQQQIKNKLPTIISVEINEQQYYKN